MLCTHFLSMCSLYLCSNEEVEEGCVNIDKAQHNAQDLSLSLYLQLSLHLSVCSSCWVRKKMKSIGHMISSVKWQSFFLVQKTQISRSGRKLLGRATCETRKKNPKFQMSDLYCIGPRKVLWYR